ncbi:unnamed protein product [Effrenium voratum]|uniref:PsbP C-terminal domain-containing protein n=1 Tax=Effrenium voratum TaxID=2562239 RepID=A0AA36IVD9_9DINO|nr:unnamed protein product [Effrenium voratum]CAJ1394214.1 unnamed protein product [Effrenium voratum]CAJ1433890.1 unnamed protein product [Effrenium voratum]
MATQLAIGQIALQVEQPVWRPVSANTWPRDSHRGTFGQSHSQSSLSFRVAAAAVAVVARHARKVEAVQEPNSESELAESQESESQEAETGHASPKANKWLSLFQRLFRDMGGVASRPRRDFTYWSILAAAFSLAIGSDFLGIMRALLSLNPEAAREAGLDQVYPVSGLKSFRQAGRYRLRYPGDWLQDQSIAFSKQAQMERPTLRQKKRIIPDAAFGPAGGGLASPDTAQNLSVVVQAVQTQDLQALLGEPREAFQRLSAETFAPDNSCRSAELLSAQLSAKNYYELEYRVSLAGSEGPVIHCWSLVALRPSNRFGELYTMTLVVPEREVTSANRHIYDMVWHSFELE